VTTTGDLDWTEDGQPRSTLYGDVYYSAEDGLAESRAVYLAGCGLPEAWTDRSHFVVAELGFGTGLNILALVDLWRRTARSDQTLQIFSIEAHLISADEARRALAVWPELADLAKILTDQWPARRQGRHRMTFPGTGVTLDLALQEVGAALEDWSGQADAWFLDGFSPALNPAMWRDEVIHLVGKQSAPGARLASFTVAGAVRRALESVGFSVAKVPGFGRKRERLEARLPGSALEAGSTTVAIIGAGIAGASVARALRELGHNPVVFEAVHAGSGASGNPAALVTPRLDAGLGHVADLAVQAFERAIALYRDLPEAHISKGVLQLAFGPGDIGRFTKIAEAGLFAPDSLHILAPEETSLYLGEPQTVGGLLQDQALVIEPRRVLDAWIGQPHAARVHDLSFSDGRWHVIGADRALLGQFDAIILAGGADIPMIWDTPDLTPVRGQASWTQATHPPGAAAWSGYIIPTRNGHLFGSTYDRGDTGTDLRPEDHQRNLDLLALGRPGLVASLSPASDLEGRARLRATTVDQLPLAGETEHPGLFVLTGLGSRGFTWGPLMGDHVASLVAGTPSPLPGPLARLIDPARFAERAGRRGQPYIPARRPSRS